MLLDCPLLGYNSSQNYQKEVKLRCAMNIVHATGWHAIKLISLNNKSKNQDIFHKSKVIDRDRSEKGNWKKVKIEMYKK